MEDIVLPHPLPSSSSLSSSVSDETLTKPIDNGILPSNLSTDEPIVYYNQSLTALPAITSTTIPSLTVCFNQLTVLSFTFTLPYLRKLDISHNLVTSLPILSEYTPNLVSLNVAYNQLTNINHLTNCTKLEQLRFEVNQMIELESIINTLSTCTALRSIVGYSNPCFDIAQQVDIYNEQQLQEKRRHHHHHRTVPTVVVPTTPNVSTTIIPPTPTPSSSSSLSSSYSTVNPSSVALLIIHSCPDLRALVLQSPSLSIGSSVNPVPLSENNEINTVTKKTKPLHPPAGLTNHNGRSQVDATAFTGMIDMSDGTGINAQTIAKSCLLKVTPDIILQAQSWYVNKGKDYLLTQKKFENDYKIKLLMKEKEQQQQSSSSELTKDSKKNILMKGNRKKELFTDNNDTFNGSTEESPLGSDNLPIPSTGGGGSTKPPRIPLNQIKHKVPSRTVPSSKSRKESNDQIYSLKRILNSSNDVLSEPSSKNDDELDTTTLVVDNDKERKPDNENNVPTSPTTVARQALANFQSRKEGILAALAALPDFNNGINYNAGSSSLSDTENNDTSSSLLITNAVLPVGNIAGGLRRAAAALNNTSNAAYTSGRTMNGTKRKEDVDIARILKNAKEVTVPVVESLSSSNVTTESTPEGNASSIPKALPRIISNCTVYRIDKDTGALETLTSPSSSPGFIMLQDGTIHDYTNDESLFTTPIAVRSKDDGTLSSYWPNGSLAIEVNNDERTNRGLQKWSQQISGSSLFSIPKALHLTAYSRETTGKNRNLAISWDGLGSGTICSTTGSTLLVNNEDGRGHHTDGKTKGSILLRAWNNPGNITYTANAYQITDLNILSNQNNDDSEEKKENSKEETNPSADSVTTAFTTESSLSSSTVPEVSSVPAVQPDSSIRQAKDTIAAALAAAEATNAAIQAIMRTRALLTNHGLAAPAPSKEDFGKDPRAVKVLDEQYVRQLLLQLLFPDMQNKLYSYFQKHNTLPKVLKSLHFYSNSMGIGFPIGQHLGILVKWNQCGGPSSSYHTGLEIYVFQVCNDVRFVVHVQPRILNV